MPVSVPEPASTAARATAGALARHALTTAGTALVAHGRLDQATATSTINPLADYLVGGAIVVASASWSALRARAVHWRWVLRALYPQALPAPAVPAGALEVSRPLVGRA